MKTILKYIAFILVIGLIVIQFFRPERNEEQVTQSTIFFHTDMPELVKKSLVNSCFDCHSGQTRYPWYANIAPVSWFLDGHIREGKEHLDFSRWGDYTKREQIKLLSEICEVVEERSMPLKSYTLIHNDARLFDHEIEDICKWTEAAAEKLFRGE